MIVNEVRAGRLVTLTVPWWAGTTALTMARPRPVLPAAWDREESPRTNRSNNSGRRSGGIPGPLSVTLSWDAGRLKPAPAAPPGASGPGREVVHATAAVV